MTRRSNAHALAGIRRHRAAQGDAPMSDEQRPTHDERFAAFRAEREAERAQAVKVTWRKVADITGGGWSGLGPDGQLVYVSHRITGGLHDGHHAFGRVDGKTRTAVGTELTLARAKRAAEALFTHDAPQAQKEAPMATTTTTNPTAESLMKGIGTATTPDKAPYSRLQVDGKTLAYCSTRKDGVLLDFATAAVEGAPKRFASQLEAHGNRTRFRVTAKNEKAARALLAWVAKQIG